MTGDTLPPLPEPPADPATLDPLIEELPAGTPLYRIHRGHHAPLFFGPPADAAGRRRPGSRFDDPEGEYGVLYAGLTVEAAFAETFLRLRAGRLVALADLRTRLLTTLAAPRPLRLVALHGAGLAALGLDARIAAGDHAVPRRWSRALRDQPAAPDGLAYRCRHDDSVLAVALFDHRLQLAISGSIGLALAPGVLRGLVGRYRLAVH